MMKKILNIRGQRGAAAVEFAILLPVLVLLLFGTIEFGLLLFNKQVITNASREGARAGIVSKTPRLPFSTGDPTKDSITKIVGDYCLGNLVTFGAPNVPIVTCSSTGQEFGDDLTVTVSYNYGFLVLGNLGFGDIALQARTVMKYD